MLRKPIRRLYVIFTEMSLLIRLLFFTVILIVINTISKIPNIFDGDFSICLFRHITGLPCPGCGVTRSILYISQGKFQESFYLNPFGLILSLTFLLFFLFPINFMKITKLFLNFIHSKSTSLRILLLIVALSIILFINYYRTSPF